MGHVAQNEPQSSSSLQGATAIEEEEVKKVLRVKVCPAIMKVAPVCHVTHRQRRAALDDDSPVIIF